MWLLYHFDETVLDCSRSVISWPGQKQETLEPSDVHVLCAGLQAKTPGR